MNKKPPSSSHNSQVPSSHKSNTNNTNNHNNNSTTSTAIGSNANASHGGSEWFTKRLNFSDLRSKVTQNLFTRGASGNASSASQKTEQVRKTKEQEWEKHLIHLFENFQLHGGPYIKDIVTANSDGRMLGGLGDDGLLQMRWYRASGTTNAFDLIDGTSNCDWFLILLCVGIGSTLDSTGIEGGFYQPSVDDIGARLLCQAANAENEGQSGWAEWGPLAMGMLSLIQSYEKQILADIRIFCHPLLSTDPEDEQECQKMINDGEGFFTVELIGTFDKHRQLKVTSNEITVDPPEEEDNDKQTSRKGQADTYNISEEEIKKLSDKVLIPCTKDCHIYIDPVTATNFSISLPSGSMVNGISDPEDLPSSMKLKVASNIDRDKLAYVVRHFCGYEANGDPKAAIINDASLEVETGNPPETSNLPETISAPVDKYTTNDNADSEKGQTSTQEESTADDMTVASTRKDDEVRELRRQLEELSKKHQQAMDEKKQLKNEIKGMNNDVTQLQKSLADARRELEWKGRKLEKVSDELEELKKSHGEVNTSVEEYESQLQTLRQEHEQKSSEIQNLQTKLRKVEESDKSFKQEVDELRKENTSKDEEIETLRQQTKDFEGQFEQTKKERDNLRRQVSQLKETITNSEHERDKLSQKLGVVQGALDEARETARNASEQSKKEAAAASKAESELKYTKDRLKQLEEENKSLRESSGNLEEKTRELQSKEDEILKLTQQLKEQRDSANEFRSERNSYKQKLSSIKKDIQRKLTELYEVSNIEQEKQIPLHQQLEKILDTMKTWKARMGELHQAKERSQKEITSSSSAAVDQRYSSSHTSRAPPPVSHTHQHAREKAMNQTGTSGIDADMQRIILDVSRVFL